MSKKINKKNIYTQSIRISEEVKNILVKMAFNYNISQCHIANVVLLEYLDSYNNINRTSEMTYKRPGDTQSGEYIY